MKNPFGATKKQYTRSCLEYGHSCWGAHGKRSGNNKIYHPKDKALTEFDFQDLSGLNEKSTYGSTEVVLNRDSDTLLASNDVDNLDHFVEGSDKKSMKLNKFFYRKPNKSNENARLIEIPEHYLRKTNSMPAISERWRRLPLYSLKVVRVTRPGNDWWNEQQQQVNPE